MEQTPKEPQQPNRPDTTHSGQSASRKRSRSKTASTAARASESTEVPATTPSAEPAQSKGTETETNTTDSVKSPLPPSTTLTPAAGQPQSGSAIAISLVALIIGLGSLGFSGWVWHQDQQLREQKAALNAEVSHLKSQLQQQGGEFQQRLSQLQQAQLKNEQAMGAVDAHLATAQAQIQAEQQKLRTLQPKTWLLAEASFLTQIAERKLLLEYDPGTSLALLQDADSRLALLANNTLKPIRQALAKDMAAVQALPRIDRDGIAMGIEALVTQLDSLPLNRVELPEVLTPASPPTVSRNLADWRHNLLTSWHALMDDFITVRRRQEQVQPLLAPEQEWYLREHLRGKLLQAQLALYHGDQQAFSQALKTAQSWVRDYFNLDSSQVEAALTQLDQWQHIKLPQAQHIQFEALNQLMTLADKKLLQETP